MISTHGIDTFTFVLKGTMESKKFHAPHAKNELRRRASNPIPSNKQAQPIVSGQALTSPPTPKKSIDIPYASLGKTFTYTSPTNILEQENFNVSTKKKKKRYFEYLTKIFL